jgi:hypothetical protein
LNKEKEKEKDKYSTNESVTNLFIII